VLSSRNPNSNVSKYQCRRPFPEGLHSYQEGQNVDQWISGDESSTVVKTHEFAQAKDQVGIKVSIANGERGS
jgi:hypothetical protein